MSENQQRHLVLILARDFASRLATAVFLVDPDDNLIYFNEAAERLLGIPFTEGHVIPAQEWSRQVIPADKDGAPLAPDDRPLRVALKYGMPSHNSLRIRDAAGQDRRIEVTAFPLFAHADDCVGAMSIFWEPAE
jgi:PAS domain-containing protein